MREKFRNLKELYKYYQDEQKCREYLAYSRWEGKPICPYCNHDKVYNIENGKRYKCANKECHKKFSVTVGTIFEDSNLPLTIWFPAIYLITSHKKGISSLQLGRDLGITQKSAWFVNHRVREMLKEKSPVMLTNNVEVDETFIGGKIRNRHANKKPVKSILTRSEKRKLSLVHYDKIAVLGLVERDGKVVAKRIDDTRAASIIPIIEQHVTKGTTMLTDEWYAYGSLNLRGYVHKSIQHNLKIYVQGEVHTNTIENFWSILKRGLYGIYHYTSKKHLNRYLDEFCARYNTRELGEGERFDLYLTNCSNRRLTYEGLIA